ncbi:substrate-binding domain-containing protein [Streptacidiphilus monticola]
MLDRRPGHRSAARRKELGIRVPEDLAVIGFDDIKEAAFADPPLTTIASDRDGMARAAVDLVLDDSLFVPGSDTPASAASPADWSCAAAAAARRRVSRGVLTTLSEGSHKSGRSLMP